MLSRHARLRCIQAWRLDVSCGLLERDEEMNAAEMAPSARSMDPSRGTNSILNPGILSRKPPETQGKRIRSLERTMVEKNGE